MIESERLNKNSIVKMSNVIKEFKYNSGVIMAVNNVSLEIYEKEFVIIQGPSGSGKSTFLYLLSGLINPTKGEIYINSIPIHNQKEKIKSNLRRKYIGIVFQSFNLHNELTVLDNILVPLIFSGESIKKKINEIDDLLKEFNLLQFKNEKVKNLSGGEMQTVSLVRAIINNPKIILADEPTGSLDHTKGKILMDYLRRVNEINGTTIIMVTHDSSIIGNNCRVFNMLDGNMKEK